MKLFWVVLVVNPMNVLQILQYQDVQYQYSGYSLSNVKVCSKLKTWRE